MHIFYAKHFSQNTNYKKIFAFGISGTEKKHKITPLFINDRGDLFELEDVESFISFNEKNIDEYYLKDVLKESTDTEKELEEILSDAKELHEHLRNYGNMKDEEKPLVVSGILLALRERDNGNFNIENLNGDSFITDGQKIYQAIESSFRRTDLSPVTKIDKILSQFTVIKDSMKLNEINKTLKKTPLRFFTEFLDEHLYKSIKYTKSAEDYLGRFYGEFMRYSGGSGQTLGIVLTPRHITELFCDLLELKTTDRIFDPCCGTGGFLVAALHTMLSKTENESEKLNIRKNQLYGIELRPDMFTVATTNMILRGDGKSNLHCDDFLMKNPKQLQTDFRATVGMLNPPYSQGSKEDPDLYEISFTEHLLDSLLPNSKCAVIVPQSSMTGKTNEEKSIKENILKHHTLEGVIMLQKDTFYGIGVIPCIAVFTSGQPHPKDKICKFINFEDDGYKVAPHIGLLETEAAKDKKQHLLDVWFDRLEAENKFCVKTTVNAEDEWLHSFYYFNDEIPTQEDFEKTVGDYLTFEFSMIMQGRKYLFEESSEDVKKNFKDELESREWREFFISGNEGAFKIESTSSGIDKNKLNLQGGNIPYITRSDVANGINLFLSEKQQSKYKIDSGNCITIGLDTQTVFYQPHSFFTGQNIQVLGYENCTKENALFISNLIQLQMVKFNWGGNGATLGRLSRTKILLPVTASGEIDYEFMESFIQKLENTKLDEYKEYAKKRVNEILFSQKIENAKLEEKNWKEFQLSDIFNISPGVRLTSANMKSGNRPFVGASDSNNGITNFVSNENKSIDKNVLGVNYNGSVVENFYHPYECIFSDDVKRFHLKNWKEGMRTNTWTF
ncbi:MAG: N-6 DNA methylase [Treponema sp.]|nr:N-6 DNA methylase [Candidatus Treponema equifaecale]